MNNESSTEIEIIYTVIYAFIAFLMMTISVLVFIYYSRKKIIQKEIEKKDLEIKYQKEMLNAAILTQEKERKRAEFAEKEFQQTQQEIKEQK